MPQHHTILEEEVVQEVLDKLEEVLLQVEQEE